MAPDARYESEDVSPKSLGEPLHFEFSGKTAPNRLYALLSPTAIFDLTHPASKPP